MGFVPEASQAYPASHFGKLQTFVAWTDVYKARVAPLLLRLSNTREALRARRLEARDAWDLGDVSHSRAQARSQEALTGQGEQLDRKVEEVETALGAKLERIDDRRDWSQATIEAVLGDVETTAVTVLKECTDLLERWERVVFEAAAAAAAAAARDEEEEAAWLKEEDDDNTNGAWEEVVVRKKKKKKSKNAK